MRISRLLTLFGAMCLPLMVYSTSAAAIECTFGPDPFFVITAEAVEGSITSDVLRDTLLYNVIPEMDELVGSVDVEIQPSDISCKPPRGTLLLPMVNITAPPVIRTINYMGNTYDVYATNQAWAGYIVQTNFAPFVNGDFFRLSADSNGRPSGSMSLYVLFVKLENPFSGTVGQLDIWLQPQSLSFDIRLPDGRHVNVPIDFNSASVDVMGVVCSLNAPAELDLGDVAIGDLKQPGTVPAVTLALGIHCGSGYDMEGQRIPDSMQVQFMGGTEPGLLDSDQGNVKFQINDRYDQALLFSSAYEVSALTDDGNLTANNAINLSVKPMLKNINGDVSVGSVGGNLGIQVIYK